MKKSKLLLGFILPIVFVSLLVISCKKDKQENVTIGGDTDYAENKVGAKSTGSIYMNGTSVSNQVQTTVVENSSGIVSVQFTGKIPSQYTSLIENFGNKYYKDRYTQYKPKYVDANGNVNVTIKLINSSEGVAYVNSTGKQFVVMKYDANVGDKWSYTKKNGHDVNFEVKQKSTTDDYAYGFMNIKVVKIEQTVDELGFTKIVYIGNHKFGLVGIEINVEDGTVVKLVR